MRASGIAPAASRGRLAVRLQIRRLVCHQRLPNAPGLDSTFGATDDAGRMKSGFTAKSIALLCAAILGAYLILFFWIEHSRQTKGPWEVEFQTSSNGDATLVVSQPHLKISNAQIIVHGALVTNAPGRVAFNQVKLPVPFGQVIFEDLTFLPGVVTFNLLGHEVELLPRCLVVNKKLVPWQPGMTVDLWPTNKPAEPPHPPKTRG